MLFVRYAIFYFLDKVLPRGLAILPYEVALTSLKQAIEGKRGIKVWRRNSIEEGNFIFGVSDLDLTIFLSPDVTRDEVTRILAILREHKVHFPFIGEANFIHGKYVESLSKRANSYELLRDPELIEKLHIQVTKEKSLEKIVFLLRMLFSDYRKLSRFPWLRQKKWEGHARKLNLNIANSTITVNTIISELTQISNIEPKAIADSFMPIANRNLTDLDLIQIPLPPLWKYFFPNKYVWFLFTQDEGLEDIKETVLADICYRQIEWEIWGLWTQFPYLKYEGLSEHLDRLKRVAVVLRPDTDINEDVEVLLELASYN